MKRCTRCYIILAFECFSFRKDTQTYRRQCKQCMNSKARKRVLDNHDVVVKQKHEHYLQNKNKYQANCARWNSSETGKKYKKTWEQKRMLNNINYRLAKILRGRLYKALKGGQKNGSAISDLGCTIEELKVYLESKFLSKMCWENYGKWHIDHIIPLSKFDLSSAEQIRSACHYTNLQPLWAIDNLKKGAK